MISKINNKIIQIEINFSFMYIEFIFIFININLIISLIQEIIIKLNKIKLKNLFWNVQTISINRLILYEKIKRRIINKIITDTIKELVIFFTSSEEFNFILLVSFKNNFINNHQFLYF